MTKRARFSIRGVPLWVAMAAAAMYYLVTNIGVRSHAKAAGKLWPDREAATVVVNGTCVPDAAIAVYLGEAIRTEDLERGHKNDRLTGLRLVQPPWTEPAYLAKPWQELRIRTYLWAIDARHVNATEKEIRQVYVHFHDMFGLPAQQVMFEEIRERYKAIVAGLSQVIYEAASPTEVYRESVRSVLPECAWPEWEWNRYVEQYDTATKLQEFQAGLPKTVEDLYETSRPSFRTQVIQEKLLAHEPVIEIDPEEVESRYRGDSQFRSMTLQEALPRIQYQIWYFKEGERLARWLDQQILATPPTYIAPEYEGLLEAVRDHVEATSE